jgi:hypothetical protein
MDTQDTKPKNSKMRDITKEMLLAVFCCALCFVIGSVSAWLGTTEDFDRAARQAGTEVDYQAMQNTALKDALAYGGIFAFAGIPLYGVIFGIRASLWRFRNSD